MEAPAPGFKKTAVAPVRLGHLAGRFTGKARSFVKFYEEFLGFRYTDDIQGIATFLTCNRDHHVINVVTAPESRLHHIAFELKGHRISCSGGRQSSCRRGSSNSGVLRATRLATNIAGYHYDPDKVIVELYTEMDQFIPELGLHEPRPWHETSPDATQDLATHRTERLGSGVQFQSGSGVTRLAALVVFSA